MGAVTLQFGFDLRCVRQSKNFWFPNWVELNSGINFGIQLYSMHQNQNILEFNWLELN